MVAMPSLLFHRYAMNNRMVFFALISLGFSLLYVAFILGMMAWMANKAAKTTPKTIVAIPIQPHLLQTIAQFAEQNGYKERPELSLEQEKVWRKGRGWLTSLTQLHFRLQADGHAELEVQEGANFLVKILFFPINAGTLLGLPVRQRKVKKLNKLLQALNAAPIEFPKGKRIKVKK